MGLTSGDQTVDSKNDDDISHGKLPLERRLYALMKLSGPWENTQVSDFLHQARIPVRLGVTSPGGEGPLVVSLWFLWRKDAFWCASNANAAVVKALKQAPECGFEVAGETPPYHGVRGQGRAEIMPDGDDLLGELYQRFGGRKDHPFADWLLNRDVDECTIRITPHRMMSWDYRKRMAGAFG